MSTVGEARRYVATFDPFRLTIARQYRAMKRIDLARHLDISPSAVTQLENGSTRPKAKTLAQIAMALGFQPAFFSDDGHRKKIDDHGRAFFRSLRSTRQIDRDQAEAQAFFASELLDGLERHIRLPPLDVPTNLHVPEDAAMETIELRAEDLRRAWTIPAGPIANMVRLLEAHGVAVMHCAAVSEDVHAFSRWFGRRPIVVLSSERDDRPRLRFDAAHELGHLVLHAEVEPGNRILEQQAHRFAAALLMPRDQIARDLPPTFRIEEYGRLKRTWGVSIQALLYRAHELGRMSDATYRRAMMRLSAHGLRKNEPYPIPGHEELALWPKAKEILTTKNIDVSTLAAEVRLPLDFVDSAFNSQKDDRPFLALS